MSDGLAPHGWHRPSGLPGICVILFLVVVPGFAGDRNLFYFVRDGEIVFTNTPSRVDARSVPGLEPSPGLSPASLPATPFDPYIENVARRTGLSPSLIKAVALVESGFDPGAVSPKGAMGLMQLMPATAAQYGVRNAFDPGENLMAGALHLRSLLDEFQGNLTLALAAYNAGSGAVRRHGGVPEYRETQDYVRRVHEKLGRRPGNPGKTESPGHADDPVRLVRRADGTILLAN